MEHAENTTYEAQLLAAYEDAQFRLAVVGLEARRAEALIVEADAGDEAFSPETMDRTFERTLPRVLRRMRRARCWAGIRLFSQGRCSIAASFVAAALIVVLIGGISALAVSENMRRSLSRLLVDPQKEFTDFRIDDATGYDEPVVPDGFEGEFYPAYIPQGYSLTSANWAHALYEAPNGAVLFYDEYDESTVVGLDTEDADITYTKVGGTDAMLVQKNGLTSVVWSFANRFFVVSIKNTAEEAIKIAESLVVIHN